MIETTQGSQTRKFLYDSLGRLIRQKLAEQTATLDDNGAYVGAGHANARWSEAFVYDSRSNLERKTDPRGVKTHYSYEVSGNDDPFNRLRSVVYEIPTTTGDYDDSSPIHGAPAVTYEYMTTGDKTRIKKIRTDGLLTEDFVYDTEGRVKDYIQKVDYGQDFR